VNPAILLMFLLFVFIFIAPILFNLFKTRKTVLGDCRNLAAVEFTPPTNKAEVFEKNYHYFFSEMNFFFEQDLLKRKFRARLLHNGSVTAVKNLKPTVRSFS